MNPSSSVTLRSGREMPLLGLGTWQLRHDTAGTTAEALRLGYRMIDTSGDYGTQPGVGEGIRASGVERDDIFLITKIEEDEDAYAAAKRNVSELGVDAVDLILVHRPPDDGVGEDLWNGLIRARDEGLTRDIGVSNYSETQMEALMDATGVVPTVNQIEWTPFGHSLEMLDFAEECGICIQAYSPLTRGTRIDDEVLAAIAKRHQATPAQVLIRWNLQQGTVPLPKANRRDHLRENLGVFDFELDVRDMAALSELNERYSALGQLAYA